MEILHTLKDRIQRYGFICFSYSIQFWQPLKGKKTFLFFLTPFFIIRWIGCVILEYSLGTVLAYFRKKQERKRDYEDELSIVAIVKNEAPYMVEWIEFHKLAGASRFYIYDNESNDNLKSILKPYIENGEVVYIFFPGKSRQLSAYNDALEKYRNKSRYMAFIDLDEFLIPGKYGKQLPETIEEILGQKLHAAGIGVTWRVFGSSGYDKKPEGLVTERYLKRGVDKCWQNYHIKTVCNPRLVKKYASPHFPSYVLGAWNINENGRRLHAWFPLGQCYEKIKINHYFCKSKEEAILKWNRGLADRNQKYDWKKFEEYDLNQIYDDSMKPYLPELKKRIEDAVRR